MMLFYNSRIIGGRSHLDLDFLMIHVNSIILIVDRALQKFTAPYEIKEKQLLLLFVYFHVI